MFKTNHKNHRAARTVRAIRAFGRRVLGIRFRRYLPYTSVPVLLAVALMGSYCTQATEQRIWASASMTGSIPVSIGEGQDDLVARAKRDPAGLLADALDRYDRQVRDYVGVFTRQEVHNGKLRPLMVCRFRFREAPFSVAMQVTKGADHADRMLYVEGRNDGRMLVHPTGLVGKLMPCVAIDPEGAQARQNTSRTIKDFGLRNALQRLLGRYRESRRDGQLRTECLGIRGLDGQQVLILKATDRLGEVRAELDVDRLVPLRIRTYDPKGKPVGLFVFNDLQFNQGLGDEAFSKESNGLAG